MDIKNQVALVTGGASGLGEATLRALVGAGAKAVIADLNAERGETIADELGDGVVFQSTDVSNADAVQAAVDRAGELGDLRVAVSCAGIGPAAKIVGRDGSPHDLGLFQKVIGVNLIGTFNVLRIASAAMAKLDANDDGERGVVINTASIAAFEGQVGQAAYTASKGGVVGLTLPAARDLTRSGVRVMTIAPGTFDTPLLAGIPQEYRDKLAAGIPFPARLGDPAEFGRLALSIVENAYLNGTVIRLDGAQRMPPR
ncbi:MAG: 3-hydroxyacyl-CoA dehydrogenase [Acidobacteriota bacterium]